MVNSLNLIKNQCISMLAMFLTLFTIFFHFWIRFSFFYVQKSMIQLNFFLSLFQVSSSVKIHENANSFLCNGFLFFMVVKFKCADENKQHEKANLVKLREFKFFMFVFLTLVQFFSFNFVAKMLFQAGLLGEVE